MTATTTIEGQITEAYDRIATRGTWVGLVDLRNAVGDVNRHMVDEALARMNRRPDVALIPESNQKALGWLDRECAVVIGDQAKHLICVH
jgi:hypothetical protein